MLPYSNQQIGGALGGPIVKDKLHYFFSYERENEPATIFTPPPQLGGPELHIRPQERQNSFLGRGDWQMSPSDTCRCAGRTGTGTTRFVLGGRTHPSLAPHPDAERDQRRRRPGRRCFSDNRVAQLPVGYNRFLSTTMPQPGDVGTAAVRLPRPDDRRAVQLPAASTTEQLPSRYDLTWTHDKHDIKIGGEYIHVHNAGTVVHPAVGRMMFTFAAVAGQHGAALPDRRSGTTRRRGISAALDSIVQRFDLNFDAERRHPVELSTCRVRPGRSGSATTGASAEADGQLRRALGRRLGRARRRPGIIEQLDSDRQPASRAATSASGQDIRDHKNIAPRGGFTYNVGGNNDFVIRGGTGLYYATPVSNMTFSPQIYSRFTSSTFVNDGQPGFVTDPTRGITADDILSGARAAAAAVAAHHRRPTTRSRTRGRAASASRSSSTR